MHLRYLKLAVLALFDPITRIFKPNSQHEDKSPPVRPPEVAGTQWPHLLAHVDFMTPESKRQRGQHCFHRPMY